MPINAIMLGSIGAVVESSDIQRRAYNQAMAEAGLSWQWDRDTYAELLEQSGGKDRLACLAAATNTTLSADQIDAIHTRKTELAGQMMMTEGATLRPGVSALIGFAKSRGMKLGFVTTTYQPNIDAVFAAAKGAIVPGDFDYIGSRERVIEGKPAPEAYYTACRVLGVDAVDAVAVEDTALSIMSAKRAGLTVIATPGALTANQDFWQADLVVGALGDDRGLFPSVRSLIAPRPPMTNGHHIARDNVMPLHAGIA
jgi:beta-phosphoglucomutase-like phosphatase (HAD superfamily)